MQTKEEKNARVRAYRLKNIEKIREARRKYQKLHGPVNYQRYKKTIPEKLKARRVLRKAVARGTVRRGLCAVCGTNEKIEGHHEDYSKPFDVIWLCFSHHRDYHYGKITLP